MIKINITGGTRSGRSVVASLLALFGVLIRIANEESKWPINNSSVTREKLTALFGPGVYTNEGSNKKLLASYTLNNPEWLQQVNQVTHPEVNRHLSVRVKRQIFPSYATEPAISSESDSYRVVDAGLMVYALKELRIERTLERGSALGEEIECRINSQMSDEEKKDRSDHVIHSDNRRALTPQVGKPLCWLQSQ